MKFIMKIHISELLLIILTAALCLGITTTVTFASETKLHTKAEMKFNKSDKTLSGDLTSIDRVPVASVKLSKSSAVYNGKIHGPYVIVKDLKGTTLRRDIDYIVSVPDGRKKVGKYIYKVNFFFDHIGSENLTFTIRPRKTAIATVTSKDNGFMVTWNKRTVETTGYQLQYDTNGMFSRAKTITISNNRKTSTSLSRLSSSKKYYIRIRTYKTVDGSNIYSNWSKSKYVITK